MTLADDLNQLLDVFSTFISDPLKKHNSREHLVEIVLDIGRRPETRLLQELLIVLPYCCLAGFRLHLKGWVSLAVTIEQV